MPHPSSSADRSRQATGQAKPPGLLQTEDYARALLHGTLPYASNEEIENRVTARIARQALLGREDPPKFWAITDEAAVRRQVGGRDVMRAQLSRLRAAAERPNVTIQVARRGDCAGCGSAQDGYKRLDGVSVSRAAVLR